MHVTWNLAYSGSTAEKLLLSEILSAANTYNTTDTEFKKIKAQESVEVLRELISPSSKDFLDFDIE
jgi:hypothetical protein